MNRIKTESNQTVQYGIVPYHMNIIFLMVRSVGPFFIYDPYRLLACTVWYILYQMIRDGIANLDRDNITRPLQKNYVTKDRNGDTHIEHPSIILVVAALGVF